MKPEPTYHAHTSMDDRSMDFTELMASHQPALLAYVRSLVADPDVAKDVLQQTNLVLLKKARDFQPGSNFSAWAHRVAYFEVLTQRRTMGRERIVFDEALLEKIATTAEQRSDHFEDRREALRECMKSLPEKQRELLTRRFVDQKKVAAIARLSGINGNAVSQQIFRAKSNLLKCVNQRLQSKNASES